MASSKMLSYWVVLVLVDVSPPILDPVTEPALCLANIDKVWMFSTLEGVHHISSVTVDWCIYGPFLPCSMALVSGRIWTQQAKFARCLAWTIAIFQPL